MSARSSQPHFDVVIVGAGAVGTTLACALRHSGLRIALLDAHAPSPYPAGADLDLRVFAVSPGSQRILNAVGAWPQILARQACPYTDMHVWDATGSGCIHFNCADVGAPALGHIVENSLIQYALRECLKQSEHVSALHPVMPESLTFEPQHVSVILKDGQRLRTRLLVAADGAHSATRELAGIDINAASYDQQAIVAHVVTEKPHDRTAWQRFLPSGPIALLPLLDGRCSVVWSLDDARAQEVRQLDDAQFCDAITAASAAVLGRVTRTTPRAAFPLQRMHARSYVRARVALIGDAAHAVHPLAGQGVNLGLMDSVTLAGLILDAHARQRDVGDWGVLRRYARARKGENLAMITALDGFKRLFSNDITALSWLRNAGLCAVDRFTPLKRVFMHEAMGLNVKLPSLAR